MKRRAGKGRGAVLFCAVAVASFTMLTGVAFAGESGTSATLSGGSLNISTELAAGTFATTLTGAAAVLDGTGFSGFSINDPRGIGVGWNVTMQATVFDNATVAGKDLVANSFTAPLFGVVMADAGSSAVPGTLGAAATIDTGVAGVVMAATSANGQGMGTYNFTAASTAWKLALTADEYAGTYNSTVTTTLATLALPAFYGFSPASGIVGAEVSLTGVGFTGATLVSFNGTAAVTMTVVDDTHITVTVPVGATTGSIVVTAPGGIVTSATVFTVTS